MSDATLLEVDLTEARTKAKDVRQQLRALAQTLSELANEVADQEPVATGRLTRARLNLVQAIDALPCTDTSQLPF